MSGLSGYIDYDGLGRPYAGLMVEAGIMRTQIVLCFKDTAVHDLGEIIRQLKLLQHDLINTPDKLIEVKGDVNGLLNKPGRGQGTAVSKP